MNYNDGFGPGMYDGDIDINITNQNVNENTNVLKSIDVRLSELEKKKED